MKSALTFTLLILLFTSGAFAENHYALIVHGGAGITKGEWTSVEEKQVRQTMKEAVAAGKNVLAKGGTSLDAVETVIRILEDSPYFNAGKGAVFSNAGVNELDAAIMDGATLKAGAVAGVMHIKNPISLARMVMEKSNHVMLVRDGAEEFAKQNGVTLVDTKYFFTQKRWDQLQKAKQKEKESQTQPAKKDHLGTVGVVALDLHGNIAAGTSTGGLTNKRFGRVGDSPIIGAGTYANNKTCGVSASGTGEYFMRTVAAYDVSALMEYKSLQLGQAATTVIDKITKLGGDGGFIALDANGNPTIRFNTEGMTCGYLDASGEPSVAIYKEEFPKKMLE
ncbi:MAG: hypothetical protein C5B54_06890 [Acidobacteria bacterium]|nr:MAG: hypothetical protein C5B54_06890 [Acidobacteriota bacterium]